MKFILITFFLSISMFVFSQEKTDLKPVTPAEQKKANEEHEKKVLKDEQIATAKKEEGDKKSVLSGLLNFNFSGNNKGLGNLTPTVDYGWTKPFGTGKLTYELSVNPYVSGQIDVKDSSSFIPALMLPGTFGIKFNFFLKYKLTTDLFLYLSPANFGYKLISNFADSNQIIYQHNVRVFFGIEYSEQFILGFQYTHAWHNSISESQKLFNKVFSTDVTDLNYFTLSLQTKVTGDESILPTFLFAEWRGVVDKNRYKGFDNLKIITFGIRSDMNINNANKIKSTRMLI